MKNLAMLTIFLIGTTQVLPTLRMVIRQIYQITTMLHHGIAD